MAAGMIRTLTILSLLITLTMGAPSCPTIQSKISSCIPYIEGSLTVESPSLTCCSGIMSMIVSSSSSLSSSDIVLVCNCIKDFLLQLGDRLVPARFSELPLKCGVPIDLPPLDNNYNCSQLGLEIAPFLLKY